MKRQLKIGVWVLIAMLVASIAPAFAQDNIAMYNAQICYDSVTVEVQGFNSVVGNSVMLTVTDSGGVVLATSAPQVINHTDGFNFVLTAAAAFPVSLTTVNYTASLMDAGGVPIVEATATGSLSLCVPYNETTVPVYSTDTAPTSGIVRIYGDMAKSTIAFEDVGHLLAAYKVGQGQHINTSVSMPGGWYVRVWFQPDGGSSYKMPSQYSPAEYGAAQSGTSPSYTTNFASLPASATMRQLAIGTTSITATQNAVGVITSSPTYLQAYNTQVNIQSNASQVTGQNVSTQNTAIGSRGYHIVQAGENLFRIGKAYGVHYLTLAQYNGIANPARIYAGQKIYIP